MNGMYSGAPLEEFLETLDGPGWSYKDVSGYSHMGPYFTYPGLPTWYVNLFRAQFSVMVITFKAGIGRLLKFSLFFARCKRHVLRIKEYDASEHILSLGNCFQHQNGMELLVLSHTVSLLITSHHFSSPVYVEYIALFLLLLNNWKSGTLAGVLQITQKSTSKSWSAVWLEKSFEKKEFLPVSFWRWQT